MINKMPFNTSVHWHGIEYVYISSSTMNSAWVMGVLTCIMYAGNGGHPGQMEHQD